VGDRLLLVHLGEQPVGLADHAEQQQVRRDDHPVAHRLDLRQRQAGLGPPHRPAVDQWHVRERLGDGFHLVQVGVVAGEHPQPVSARIDVGAAAVEGLLEAERVQAVAPPEDHEVRVGTGLARDADLLAHLVGRDRNGTVGVLARPRLVLEVHTRQARPLELAHRAPHVEEVAEALLDVAEDRDVDRVGQPPGGVAELRHGRHAHVGSSVDRARQAAAAGVDRREADALDDARLHRLERAGRDRDRVRGQCLTELRSR
jgi:hypothetical protein